MPSATNRKTPRTALVLSALTLGAAAVIPAAGAGADPRPTLQQVSARIDALNTQIDRANEAFDGARLELADAKRKAAVADAKVAGARAALRTIQRSMASVAAAAYRSGGADQMVQLISTSNPQTFLDRAASLDRIAAAQSSRLAAARTAQHRLAGVQADAAQAQKQADAVAATMAEQRSKIQKALATQQGLLSSLRADERRRLAALEESRRLAAAARASRSRITGSNADSPTYNGPASGRAAIAVQEAYRQLGKDYQWGAAGPNTFDCSGLTMWAWGKAGVSLPHYTGAQWNVGRHVAEGELQPGDLVFFGSDLHHMGMYVGGGNFIHAPHTGDVVKISSLSGYYQQNYAGAVRVTG